MDTTLSLVISEDHLAPTDQESSCFQVKKELLSFINFKKFTNIKFFDFLQKMYSNFCFSDVSFLISFSSKFVDDSRLLQTLGDLESELSQRNQICFLISKNEKLKWNFSHNVNLPVFVCEQELKRLENSSKKDRKAFLYTDQFIKKLSPCLTQIEVLHLLGENQVDWIDKILDSYLHLLLLKMFCRNTKKTRIKPSSYVKLVAMDLNTTENEFGEKLARKIQSTLKTFNVFFTEILRVKNIFVYSKLLIKINQTVENLRQIHRKKPLPSQTSLFSLFQIEICDFSNEFLKSINKNLKIMQSGFKLVLDLNLDGVSENSVKASDRMLFEKSYHHFLSAFISEHVNSPEYQRDFAQILILLEGVYSSKKADNFLSTIESIKKFLMSSKRKEDLSFMDNFSQIFFLFSMNKEKRVKAAARLFNHSVLLEKDYFEGFLKEGSTRKAKIAEYEVLLNLQRNKKPQISSLLEKKHFSKSDLEEIRDLFDISVNQSIEMRIRSEAIQQVSEVFLNDLWVESPGFRGSVSRIWADLTRFFVEDVAGCPESADFMDPHRKSCVFHSLQMILMFLVSQKTLFGKSQEYLNTVQSIKGIFYSP